MQEYKNKKVLVTGGGGLIGRQVIHQLVDVGADVISVGLDNPEGYSKYIKCDLKHIDYCLAIIKDFDYVFHLAGIKASPKITLERPSTMSIMPLMINTNVLEACRINGIKNVLFTSSIGAYAEAELLKEENAYLGEPMDLLPGTVKRMAELQIQAYQKEYGLNYKVVRLGNCYGIGDNFNSDNGMFISSLMAKVLRGDNPVEIWGDGSQIRDFVYSKDVAHGILQMMLVGDCLPINLGSGVGYSVKDVVSTMALIQGGKSFRFMPDKPTGVKKRVLDISKARSLGYEPQYTLYAGLKETWNWYKDNSQESDKRLNYFKG